MRESTRLNRSGFCHAALNAAMPPEERASYLAQACGDDAALRQRLERLLKSYERSGGFLEESSDLAVRPVAFLSVPLTEKADYLLKVNAEALKVKGPGPMFVTSNMFFTKEEKYFASTEGSSIEQTLIRSWLNFIVTSVDPKTGRFEQRSSLGSPIGKGYEVFGGRAEGVLKVAVKP